MKSMLKLFECLLGIGIILAVFAMFGCTSTSKGGGEWSVFFGSTIGVRQQGATSEADTTNSIHLEDGVFEWLMKSSDTPDEDPDEPD